MAISKKVDAFLTKASWIRKMFEEGARLKAQHGTDRVYDFSLGNPIAPPPSEFKKVVMEVAQKSGDLPHAYMPNVGYPEVRQTIAEMVSKDQEVAVRGQDIAMTCGAAGALNSVLKALLDPGEEVITPTPFFVEYTFYCDNHGGVLVTVPTHSDFSLDLDAIEKAITPKTKVVLVNSPNNPTGQIYSKQSLEALGTLLQEASQQLGHTIYLISDEPYRKIAYDDAQVPSLFKAYPNSIIATSFSKDLSIPGERLGYLALNPECRDQAKLMDAVAFCIRVLGFVNAPAFMQRVVGALGGAQVDIAQYARKRELICQGLSERGYEFVTPPGAFYLFPKAPIEDDVAFVRKLQEELILVVPGSGFGAPGYFRISYCVSDATITGALDGFERVMNHYKS